MIRRIVKTCYLDRRKPLPATFESQQSMNLNWIKKLERIFSIYSHKLLRWCLPKRIQTHSSKLLVDNNSSHVPCYTENVSERFTQFVKKFHNERNSNNFCWDFHVTMTFRSCNDFGIHSWQNDNEQEKIVTNMNMLRYVCRVLEF